MIISRDIFNSMSVDRLFNIVYNDLEKYYTFFCFFNEDKEEFYNAIKQIIGLTKRTYDCNEDYSSYMKKSLFEYFKERLAKQDDNQVQSIIELFSLNKIVQDKEQAISVLEFFQTLTSDMANNDLVVVMSRLLSFESSFSQALVLIFNENKDLILSGNIDSVVGYKLIPYFDYYCMFNDIGVAIQPLNKDFIIRQSPDAKTYLDAIDKSPILTPEEEQECIKDMDDIESFRKLMISRKKYVAEITGRYSKSEAPFLDLNRAGLETLRELVFMVPKGRSLTDYTAWQIGLSIVKEAEKYENKSRMPKSLLEKPQEVVIEQIIPNRSKIIIQRKKLYELVGCSYEELLKRTKRIGKAEKEKLKKCYGEHLDTINLSTTYQEKKEAKPIIVFLQNVGKESKRKKGKKLCELLECTRERLNELLSDLSEDKKDILKKRFGENYNRVLPFKSKEIRTKVHNIIQSLRLKIEKSDSKVRDKKLCEILGCSREKLDELLLELSEDKKEILKQRYGENYDEIIPFKDKEVKRKVYVIIDFLRYKIKNPNSKRKNRKLCEILGCSREKLDELLYCLTKKEKEYLQERFGKTFDEVHPFKNKKIKRKVHLIICKLKSRMKSSDSKTRNKKLYELLGCTLEQSQKYALWLTEKDREFLQQKYGPSLDLLLPMDKNYRIKYVVPVIRKMQRLVSIQIISKNLHELLDCSQEEVKYVREILNQEDINILQKRFGVNLDIINEDYANDKIFQIINELIRARKIMISKGKTLTDLFGRPEEQIKAAATKLYPDELRRLKLGYGENLDKFIPLPRDERKELVAPVVGTLRYFILHPNSKRRTVKENGSNKSLEERKKDYFNAIEELRTIPLGEIAISSFKIDNQSAVNNLYSEKAKLIVDMMTSNHRIISIGCKKQSEQYIEAVKTVGSIPFTRDVIMTSLKILNKSIAFMLYGLSPNNESESVDPQTIEMISSRENVSLEELEKMCKLVSSGVLKRVKRDHRIIVDYEAKQLGENPSDPEGGKLVKNQ